MAFGASDHTNPRSRSDHTSAHKLRLLERNGFVMHLYCTTNCSSGTYNLHAYTSQLTRRLPIYSSLNPRYSVQLYNALCRTGNTTTHQNARDSGIDFQLIKKTSEIIETYGASSWNSTTFLGRRHRHRRGLFKYNHSKHWQHSSCS